MGVRELTQEAFDTFLEWLSSDREEAARLHESIRRRLIIFFENLRCAFAEELADQTIDRVIRRVPKFNGKYEGDPVPYFYRVAHYVRLRYLETEVGRDGGTVTEEMSDHKRPSEDRLKELRHACLDVCLEKLPPEERQLLLDYYSGDKQDKIKSRKLLIERTGESLNALRIRVHRLRGKVRACIDDCLERQQIW